MFDMPSLNQSKIANYENIRKSKTSKSDFSKTWREKIQNMKDIIRQIRSFYS